MTIENKLTYLAGTKEAIRTAIQNKGVAVSEEDTFREYADKIAQIEGGGGGGISDYQMPLVLYAIRLRKPASASARLAIRYLDVDGPEGSLMELARGSATYNPFPTNTIDSQATSITSLGSSHSFGGGFGVENILSNDTSFWSAPYAQATSASLVFVYFLSTIDAAPAKVTVQFSDTASNRAGPSEVAVYKFSKQANDYELIWTSDEDTAPWGSNEIREFVPGGE